MLMTGLGSGIDYESMISAIVAAERAPKDNQLNRQEGINSAEMDALKEIQNTINSFRDKVEDLNSSRELQKLKAALSNEDVLSASVDSNAVAGEYGFEVTQLAQAQRDQLFKASSDATFDSGIIKFTSVSNDPATNDGVVEIDIADLVTKNGGSAVTLEDIQSAVNNHANNDFATATLVRSGNDVSLVLNAKDTGSTNGYTINTTLGSAASGSFHAGKDNLQAGKDAIVKFGSMELKSTTNKMENVIDGITLNLKAAKPGEIVTVKVERDEASVNGTIKEFVDTYNKVMETVNTYTKSSEDGAAALSGDSATRSMVSRLRAVIGDEYTSSTFKTLSQLGVTTTRQGTLEIDQKKLDKALEDDFEAVSKLFLGDDGKTGMMDSMLTVLDDYHKNGGAFDRRIDQLEYSNKRLAEDREKLDERMTAKTNSLRDYYARMDSQIAQMNQTQSMLVSMLM